MQPGETLEREAAQLYYDHAYAAAAQRYERAFVAYRGENNHLAAGLAARAIGWITGNVLGDWAVQNGWFARSLAEFEKAGDPVARGWALTVAADLEMDYPKRAPLYADAVAVAREHGNVDLEYEAHAYLGLLYVMEGRFEEGLLYLDEGLAAVCSGEITDIVVFDGIFCGFFWACEMLNDVARADQWMRAAADIMHGRQIVAAFCRAHYGAILTAAGRWKEAEHELLQASRHFQTSSTPRRSAAMIRLADLRVRQGRLEEAAQLLRGAEQDPDAARPLAALYFARGETARARDLLERATQGEGVPALIGPLLALLVEVSLAEGNVEQATHAAERLESLSSVHHVPYLRAAAALAEGRVCIATDTGDARARLHEALEGFGRAQLPMELAMAHLHMARAQAERSPEAAIAEAKAALEDFERLEAARHADEAAAVLRGLGAPARTGPKGGGTLTRRETEVLRLIGSGLSNGEIGDRLYITRKTVEHHVGSLLMKLGLRNRAEAAAYITREESGH